MSTGIWDWFDRLARRHLEDGLTDDEVMARMVEHLRELPPSFAVDEAEAREHIARIRTELPPPRTEAEAWALLDEALDRLAPSAAAPPQDVDLSTEPDGRMSLSEAEVVDARRRWQRGEGPDWRLAGVTKRSYIRARHRYRLVPWPENLARKVSPRTR